MAGNRSPFANEQEELAFLRQRMAIFDEYQKSAYAAHAAEMKEDGQAPFKGITGYGKRTAALIMMERDELAEQVKELTLDLDSAREPRCDYACDYCYGMVG